MKKELINLLKKEGLLVIRSTRKEDRFVSEMLLTDLKPFVGELTDFGLKQWLTAHEKQRAFEKPGGRPLPREGEKRTRPDDKPPVPDPIRPPKDR